MPRRRLDSKFQLVSCERIEFKDHGLRDNVALITVLQPRAAAASGASRAHLPLPVVVANTHILFNPARGDVKARISESSAGLRHTYKTAAGMHVSLDDGAAGVVRRWGIG